jgi:hypothetical protein
VDIPGTGWASPVVWNNGIFIHTNVNAAGEGAARKGMSGGRVQYHPPTEEHRSIALSIDFETGKTRWATELHRGVPKPSRHPKNSYASETPVTDGRRVYFHIGDLATYCLDMKEDLVDRDGLFRQPSTLRHRIVAGAPRKPIVPSEGQ